MAGSYGHIIDLDGRLVNNQHFVDMIDDLGDAYEMLEEMYGMIWYLAHGDAALVEWARRNYRGGIARSPGVEADE